MTDDTQTRAERWHADLMVEVMSQSELALAEAFTRADLATEEPLSEVERDIWEGGVHVRANAMLATLNAHGWLRVKPEDIRR